MAAAITSSATAADAYFDLNGATAGSGATSATGTATWDTTTNTDWTNSSPGSKK